MKDFLRSLGEFALIIGLSIIWMAIVSFVVQLGLNAILIHIGKDPVPFSVVFFPALAVLVIIASVRAIIEAGGKIV